MDFFEDSLDWLKVVVKTAAKYRVSSGLHPKIPELIRLRNSLVQKKLNYDAEELNFIINFLTREQEQEEEARHKLLEKTKELASQIPAGMLVSFRYRDETLTGELKGFVADRALVLVSQKGTSKIFEVSPFDLKI